MKPAILIIVLLLAFNLKAQFNLVPNLSFENYTSCPTASNQLNYSFPWVNPTSWGTPDYFNGCSSTFGIPSYCNCNSVFQYPNTGLGYIGLWAHDKTVLNAREYAQTQLNSQLNINSCYFISFYVNLMNFSGYACNNVGIYLSAMPVSATGSVSLLSYNSQIKTFNNKIITDTLNWIKIQGIYIANGNENYLTIGNFNNDGSTDTIIVNSSSPYGSYYLFDDISVIPIDSIPGGLPANAGPDKNIAIGDSVFIGQEISNLNCNWFISGGSQIATNTSGIYVKPNSPTTYVVEQNLCGTITYDTVNVFVSPVGLTNYEALQNSFNIYPNPTISDFTLKFIKQSGNYIVSVTDISGKEVYNHNLNVQNGYSNLDLDLNNGTYFIKVIDLKTNESIIKKLIIQK